MTYEGHGFTTNISCSSEVGLGHSSAIADHNRGEPRRRPSGLALAMSSTSGPMGDLLRVREGKGKG